MTNKGIYWHSHLLVRSSYSDKITDFMKLILRGNARHTFRIFSPVLDMAICRYIRVKKIFEALIHEAYPTPFVQYLRAGSSGSTLWGRNSKHSVKKIFSSFFKMSTFFFSKFGIIFKYSRRLFTFSM